MIIRAARALFSSRMHLHRLVVSTSRNQTQEPSVLVLLVLVARFVAHTTNPPAPAKLCGSAPDLVHHTPPVSTGVARQIRACKYRKTSQLASTDGVASYTRTRITVHSASVHARVWSYAYCQDLTLHSSRACQATPQLSTALREHLVD
eukprot:2122081-Rhodomonas_salina.2